LFALKQALNAFDFMCTQLTECDQEIDAGVNARLLHRAQHLIRAD
jgi:hypothetical protein